MKNLIILLALTPLLALAVTLSMKNYQCTGCGTVIQSETSPNGGTCPKGSNGSFSVSHSWYNLGDVGDKNYQCNKCGIVVKSNSSPNGGTCIKGSSGSFTQSHSWSKL